MKEAMVSKTQHKIQKSNEAKFPTNLSNQTILLIFTQRFIDSMGQTVEVNGLTADRNKYQCDQ